MITEVAAPAKKKVADQPKRARTKPGHVSLFVSVSDNSYHNLCESADGRPLNVWLSLLIERNLHAMLPKAGE